MQLGCTVYTIFQLIKLTYTVNCLYFFFKMNRKFGKESMKTPSVSTLIKRFDTGESNEPAGTTVTSPPRRVQTKAKSHHLQSAPLTQNKHISGAPPRSPSPFRKCTEPPQSYEPPIKPNESEHSYRESTTSDHVYIELC